MKMSNYIWLVLYVITAGFLLTSKDEFWYEFVSRIIYILIWIFWAIGFSCIIISIYWSI